ncbi:MAG: hypothetical protein LBV80_09535 [Deltaproteobacteria bacterium]|nr:hypothetical protein [Deltaproteobacteria bacterium]
MYTYNIEWTDPAWADLDEISDYLIAQEGDFQLADEIVTHIFNMSEQQVIL